MVKFRADRAMITKFTNIKDFGIFSDFSWDPNVSAFKPFNIIYGWNYSGKTTLSRVLRCFELAQCHSDYPAGQSKVRMDDGKTYSNTEQLPVSIRVFNEDFVHANFRWEEGGVESFAIVGEENVHLQERLSNKKKEFIEHQNRIKELSDKISSVQELLGTHLSTKASEIKNTLSFPDFNKTKLEPLVKEAVDVDMFPKDEFQSVLNQYMIASPRQLLNSPDILWPSLDWRLANILSMNITSRMIEDLLRAPELNAWVRKGKELHAGKTTCLFCEGDLRRERIDLLNEHFSEEYERLIEEINEIIDSIKNIKIVSSIPSEGEFYDDLVLSFKDTRDKLIQQESEYRSYLNEMIIFLQKKKDHPDKTLAMPPCPDLNPLYGSIESLYSLINTHNDRSRKFQTERAKLKELLLKHFASECARDSKYRETQKQIKELHNKLEMEQKSHNQIAKECSMLEQQLSDVVRGAEAVNVYLRGFFGKRHLLIRVRDDNKFDVIRNNRRAKNLSRGERTAISFAYFMAQLPKQPSVIANTIVFIDDPISSLDANHLYNTYSLIKNELTGCSQLFIATHNFEFMNLLKDWLNDKGLKQNASFYLISRSEQGDGVSAKLQNMPPLLRKFKSEYLYLFSILYEFKKNPEDNHDRLFLLPNIARRFLESYLGFKIPRGMGLEKKLKKVISDGVVREKIVKFLNEYSHNQSLPRSLSFPDFSECKSIVAIILEKVRAMDTMHFDEMVQEVETQ